jgi:tRNA modification GTPase
MTSDTIFALSSGQPPAALAVVRISGPEAGQAMQQLAGRLPRPRHASLATLHDPADGGVLDQALLLWFPGPATATGEDLAELHLHGGRAIVRAVESVLAALPGLRPAEPGEFTRRALLNGRIDLAEAEGLGDLLTAETEGQRRAAIAVAGGALSRAVGDWQEQLLALSARVEALLDFADEDDVDADAADITLLQAGAATLRTEWCDWLARPRAERLRDGITVAIAGPPNAGKSTLINALAGRDAAIVSPQAGTTRDIIELPLALSGVPFRFADTAGLHAGTGDAIEAEGMARARAWIDSADMLLWLGPPDGAPAHPRICRIAAQADRAGAIADWNARGSAADIILSARTGQGMDALHHWLVNAAGDLLPGESDIALNTRQAAALADAANALEGEVYDLILIAEQLRAARVAIDRITGRAGTEAMLDALFGRFCIGK